MQRAPAHFGAHGTGVFLFAQVKDNVVDLGGHQGVRDLPGGAPVRHRGEVHPRNAQIQGDGLHGKGLGIELPQAGQHGQQGQGVLAAGNAHRHAVARLNHVIILDAAAGIT